VKLDLKASNVLVGQGGINGIVTDGPFLKLSKGENAYNPRNSRQQGNYYEDQRTSMWINPNAKTAVDP